VANNDAREKSEKYAAFGKRGGKKKSTGGVAEFFRTKLLKETEEKAKKTTVVLRNGGVRGEPAEIGCNGNSTKVGPLARGVREEYR